MLSLLGTAAATATLPAPFVWAQSEDPFEGGIGGTGIVGVMTDSGSVIVNGLRIELGRRTRFFLSGQRATDSVLLPGTAMTLVAQPRRGRLEATRIDVDDPLVGMLVHHGGRLSVNGAELRVEPGALGSARSGRRVAVSGVWRDGRLHTSLIRDASFATDSVAGVAVRGQGRLLQIGGVAVQLRRGMRRPSTGEFAVVSGAYANGVLNAERIRIGRFSRASGPFRYLSAEGYLERIRSAPGFQITGLGHSFDQDLVLDPFSGTRALYFGAYDGRFVARRGVLLPESFATRRSLLRPDPGAEFADALVGRRARRVARG